MVRLLAPALSTGKNGAFLVECDVHMVENVDRMYNGITVANLTMAQALSNWWLRTGGAVTAIDTAWTQGAGQFGGNPGCPMYGPLPSWPQY